MTPMQMDGLTNGTSPSGENEGHRSTSNNSNDKESNSNNNEGNSNSLTQQSSNQSTNQNESLLLNKLQDMVPIMPQDRELSRLEIINYVIDYIRQLREKVVDEVAVSRGAS